MVNVPWSDKGEKTDPLVDDDEFMIIDSEDATPSTQNKRVTLLRIGTSFSIIGIGTNTPNALLQIGDNTNGDILRFDTERGWQFETNGTGDATRMRFRALVNDKFFDIISEGGTPVATFLAADSGGKVGIKQTDPQAGLHVDTGLSLALRNVNDINTITTEADMMINYIALSGEKTVTLQDNDTVRGRIIVVKDGLGNVNLPTDKITIDTESSALIDGGSSTEIGTPFQAIRFICDGTDWFIW